MSNFGTTVLNGARALKNRKRHPAQGDISSYLDRLNLCENNRSAYLEPVVGVIADEKIIAHAYWHGEFGRKQAFCIKSFLATQDRDKMELWLWLDEVAGYENYESNPWMKPLLPYITVKPYNPERAIAGSSFERAKKAFCQNDWIPGRADAFRIWALSQYGGFYFDIDTLFLRDMASLFNGDEFVAAWERQRYASNAFVYLRKGSLLTEAVVKKALKGKCFQPWFLFDYDNWYMRYLKLYPCCYFDPLWMGYREGMPIREFGDLFVDRDDNTICRTYRDFFPGSYTYDWHNRWGEKIGNSSYFARFEAEFDAALSELRN